MFAVLSNAVREDVCVLAIGHEYVIFNRYTYPRTRLFELGDGCIVLSTHTSPFGEFVLSTDARELFFQTQDLGALCARAGRVV